MLHPADLKSATEFYINRLLQPIRQTFESAKLKKLVADAYPAPKKQSEQTCSIWFLLVIYLKFSTFCWFHLLLCFLDTEDEILPHRLDIRIGKIVEVSKHPEADALYVEKIDLGLWFSWEIFCWLSIMSQSDANHSSLFSGEENPRTIVSGLVQYVPQNEMENRLVVVLCNLKPAKMRGIESAGMVLCASTWVNSTWLGRNIFDFLKIILLWTRPFSRETDGVKLVEPLLPAAGSKAGDRVLVEGYEKGDPDPVLNPKKKIWEKLQVI